MRLCSLVSLSFGWATLVNAQYKIYQPKNQVIFGGSALTYTHTTSTIGTAAFATYTAAAEFDATSLTPPAVPTPAIPTAVPVQLPSSGGFSNSSAPVNGGFFGFSVEMSVSNQVCELSSYDSPLGDALTMWMTIFSGKEQVRCLPRLLSRTPNVDTHYISSYIQVPFLNLMSNLVERAGWVQVRVGGNTQESAELVANLPNGTILAKDKDNTSGLTSTPPLEFTADLLYLMANISRLTNTHWYLGSSCLSPHPSPIVILIHAGIPFFNTTPFALEIVEAGQQILGDYLLGFQAGNEPDLYVDHGHRPSVARS